MFYPCVFLYYLVRLFIWFLGGITCSKGFYARFCTYVVFELFRYKYANSSTFDTFTAHLDPKVRDDEVSMKHNHVKEP